MRIKKTLCIILVVISAVSSAYAVDTALFDIRNTLFEESRTIKMLLPNSKRDLIFLNSMWDSCIITISQLDAYFTMIGLFNTIKKEGVTEDAVGYIYGWLSSIKDASDLSLKNLNAISSRAVENNTKVHIKRLIGYYAALSKIASDELVKVGALKAAARKDKPSLKSR